MSVETYNPNLLVTYKKIAGTFAAPETPEYVTDKVVSIEWELDQARRIKQDYASLRNKIDGLHDQIIEWSNPNYDKDDVIRELCEYFGINPVKQVTVTGTISFEVTVDIPLDEVDNFDAHYLLGDELTLDSNSPNVDVNTWGIEDTDVDWN